MSGSVSSIDATTASSNGHVAVEPPARSGRPPGTPLPRGAQLAPWILRPGPTMRRWQRRYGDVFRLHVDPEHPWVMIADPDAVATIFRAGPDEVHAGEANHILKPALGENSVLCLDDEAHLRQRRLLLPPFHGERMQAYRDVMREATERALERMPRGVPFALRDHTQAITLEVIMRAVFGVTERGDMDRLRAVLATTVTWFGDPRNLVQQVVLGPEHPRVRAARRARLDPLDAELYRLIGERRAAPDLAEREDILSMLVLAQDEDGGAMTDVELRDELLTLLFAGHETTATGLAWAFERMGRRPEVLERLTAEARSGSGTAYTDAVVKETLRLRPVVQIVVRRLLRDFDLAGWRVAAGETVAISIYLMHRRPDLYPQPDAFAPERFLEASPPGAYAWIPFGGGIRRCIGASFAQVEMEVVLQTLVANGRFETVGGSERPRRRAVTLVPERGAQVVLEA